MIHADMINAAFEGLAALALWNHCRVILKDKLARGVSTLSTVFFAAWGFWNLHYYPSLGQMFSFYAGALVCAVNCYYVYLLCKYGKRG